MIDNLIEWLSSPEQTRLRRSFSIWINRVIRPLGNFDQTASDMNDLVEIKTMLSQRIVQWTQEWKQQGEAIGEARGEARGEVKTLLKQLNLKFGTLPDWVDKKVNMADKEHLDLWVELVLTADTLDEIFS